MVDKPDYLSDEEWAEWLRAHPDLNDGKVVQFDKTRKRKKQRRRRRPAGGRLGLDDSAATIAAGSFLISPTS